MLNRTHNHGVRLCLGAFRTSPVECLWVDAHEPSLGARREKLSLHYAFRIKSLPTHDAVFDNQYLNQLDSTHTHFIIFKTVSFILNFISYICDKHILHNSLHCIYKIMHF